MNVGSLFSGIGGLDAGLVRAGWSHAFLCESDPWRRSVLRERFPGVPVHADVRDVAADGAADVRLADGRAKRDLTDDEFLALCTSVGEWAGRRIVEAS